MSRRQLLLDSIVLVSTLAVATAQGQQPHAPGRLRAGVSLVAVDFLALGRDGVPLVDLKPDDVTLRVDGKARVIESLQLVRVADGTGSSSEPLPPPFGTNARGTGAARALVLVLDDDSIRPGRERALRDVADRFLRSLSSVDRVALVTMPYGGTKVNLTTDHDQVRQALSIIAGSAPQSETGSEMACRTRRNLMALAGLLGGLSDDDGPAVVLFFSTGLAGPRRDAPVTRAPGACELTTDDFRRVGLAAASSRTHVYVVQPEDRTAPPGATVVENIAGAGFTGSDNPREGLEHLVGVTGGQLLHLETASDDALHRVTRETSAYYLAAFEPEASERNGQTHRIEVRLTRTDAVVRSRPEITIAKSGSKAARAPRDLLREPTTYRELPLRAAGFVSRESGDRTLKVMVLGEPSDPEVTLAAAAAAIFDDGGKLVAQWTAEPGELVRRPLVAAFVTQPGTYRLRFAATDAEGRGGTADSQLVVGLAPAGPLELSGLVLGLSRAGGLVPRLQFGGEPVALGYVEIFRGQSGQPVSVTFELARSVDGDAMLSAPGVLAATGDRHTATAAIPIGALPPGDYIVRATVTVQGQGSGRVMRTLRKVQ